MKVFCLLLLLIPVTSSATPSSDCQSFRGINSVQRFCWSEKAQGFVSEACLSSKGCDALKKWTLSPLREHDLDGGKNPSSVVCHKLGLKVSVFKDSKNNEQSFCLFSDGSYIDSNAFMRSLHE